MRQRSNPIADHSGRPHPHPLRRHPLDVARAFHGHGGPGPDDLAPGRGPRRGHGFGPGHGPRGGRFQMRRGAIREALLALLTEQPMHGYQLMQELDTRSGGRWHPSAGSIYPTLQQLEDEGLVVAETTDGRRTFALTESGRTAASALPTERPWATDRGRSDLRGLTREVGMAALQVTRVGSTEAQAQAQAILVAARRDLYRLLADEPSAGATDGADEPRRAGGRRCDE